MILDGWGVAPASEVNAAYLAQTPNLDRYFADYPHTTLDASGMEVGLPEGQIGNSEVGHLNIGAGRVVYQSLTLINKAVKDGTFFENESFIHINKRYMLKNKTISKINNWLNALKAQRNTSS